MEEEKVKITKEYLEGANNNLFLQHLNLKNIDITNVENNKKIYFIPNTPVDHHSFNMCKDLFNWKRVLDPNKADYICYDPRMYKSSFMYSIKYKKYAHDFRSVFTPFILENKEASVITDLNSLLHKNYMIDDEIMENFYTERLTDSDNDTYYYLFRDTLLPHLKPCEENDVYLCQILADIKYLERSQLEQTICAYNVDRFKRNLNERRFNKNINIDSIEPSDYVKEYLKTIVINNTEELIINRLENFNLNEETFRELQSILMDNVTKIINNKLCESI
jgi:hypothetical protein